MYAAPRLVVHGTARALTASNSIPTDGNDPCSIRAGYPKQTGLSDQLIGTGNDSNQNGQLMTCSL
jgi:hypothetical protein